MMHSEKEMKKHMSKMEEMGMPGTPGKMNIGRELSNSEKGSRNDKVKKVTAKVSGSSGLNFSSGGPMSVPTGASELCGKHYRGAYNGVSMSGMPSSKVGKTFKQAPGKLK